MEPDLSFVSSARWSAASEPVEGAFLAVVPDLVVEVLSTSTASRDRGEKRGIYERNRVVEYWLVDPRAQRITVFHLDGDRFGKPDVFEVDGVADSAVVPGFRVALIDLFAS